MEVNVAWHNVFSRRLMEQQKSIYHIESSGRVHMQRFFVRAFHACFPLFGIVTPLL